MERAASSGGRRPRSGGGGRGAPPGGAGAGDPGPEDIAGWLAGRLPADWFEGPPTVTVDRDEIVVVGRVGASDLPGGDEPARSAGEVGRISRFREETREKRMAIAREAEHRFGRNVAWGAEVGETTALFTNLSVPVMTRLRQPERRVLDTLVESGVARSRSDALAWCVKLVANHAEEWLDELRTAMETVASVRDQGPSVA